MNNPKNPNPNNREDNLTEEKTSSYGRVSGTNLKNEALEVQNQNNAASSLLIGLGITAFLGLSGLAYYFWGRPPATNSVIVVPAPVASQEPAKQTTIIEKTNTVERVPVPGVVPVAPQGAPNVNVKVDIPRSQEPRQGKTDVNVIVPNNSQPATVPQNTKINVTPESSTKTPTPTSSPDTSSKTQTSPNTPKADSNTDNKTNSNP